MRVRTDFPKLVLGLGLSLTLLAACAETRVSDMSRSAFRVETDGALICGAEGTRDIAQRRAAVEVIRRGGDLFIIDAEGGRYDGWMEMYERGLSVRMVRSGVDEASDALSAREVLGADWQTIVAKGGPKTCV